jgi:DNA polymerase-3 subunit delta'
MERKLSIEESILARAAGGKNLCEAYLITAAGAKGAERAAEGFINRLFCETSSACDTCAPCRRFRDHNLVDLMTIEGEGTLKKDAVEGIPAFLSKKAFEAKKCVYIKNAHNLTVGAQNFLLKSLEDPPNDTVFVLTSHEPEKLLATIISRAIVINMPREPEHEVRRALGERDGDARVPSAAAHAWGDRDEAAYILTDEAFWEARDAALDAAKLLIDKNTSTYKLTAALMRSDFLDVVQHLAILLVDALFINEGVERLKNPDRESEIAFISKCFTSPALSIMIDILMEAYEKKKSFPGVNTKLLCEGMVFRMLEVKTKCQR